MEKAVLEESVHTQVMQVLQGYFNSLHEGDVKHMRQIFHPACQLNAAQGNGLRTMPVDAYYPTVQARPSPHALGQPFIGRVLSLSINAQGTAASAIARTARLPRIYTDFLHLARIDARWWIVAKTYAWQELPDKLVSQAQRFA